MVNMLIFLGFLGGNFLANYLFYYQFSGIDGFNGPSLLRIVLTAISKGVSTAVLIYIYLEIFFIQYNFKAYLFSFIILFIDLIGINIYLYYYIYTVRSQFNIFYYLHSLLTSIDFLFPILIVLFSFLFLIIGLKFLKYFYYNALQKLDQKNKTFISKRRE